MYKYPTLTDKQRDMLFDQESQLIKGNKVAWSTTYGGGNPWLNDGPGRRPEDYSIGLRAGWGKMGNELQKNQQRPGEESKRVIELTGSIKPPRKPK